MHIARVAGFKLPGVYANIRDGFVHSFIQDTVAEGLFCHSGDQPRTTASSAPRGWGGWEAWSEVASTNSIYNSFFICLDFIAKV